MLRRTLSLLLLACALLGVYGHVAASANPQHDQIVSLINSERNLAGLPAQQTNPALQSVAQLQANNMAASANVTHFSINGSNASMRSATVGYNGEVNEIIFGGTAEPGGIVKWWMNSDSHRPIILTEKFAEVGVATATNAETGWTYWCVIFGAPQAEMVTGGTSFVHVPRVDAVATEPELIQATVAIIEPIPAALVAEAPTTHVTTAPVIAEPVVEAIAEPVVAAPPAAIAEANVANSAETDTQIAAITNVGMGGGGGDNSYVPSQTSAELEAAATTYAATSSTLDPIHLAIAVVAIIAAAALIFVGYHKPKNQFDPFRRNY